MLVATPDAVRTPPPGDALAPFDDAAMRAPSRALQVMAFVFRRAPAVSAVLRRVRPILRIGRLVIVSRDEDVREVLSRDADFPVPFGAKFAALDPAGANFILGMPDSAQYRAIHAETMRVFSLADIARIAAMSRHHAAAIVAAGAGRMDVVQDLLARVPLDITRDYYGVDLPAEAAHWLMVMSFFDFSPLADPAIERLAVAASQHVAAAVDAAIARAKRGGLPGTVVQRYVQAQWDGSTVLTDPVIRATVTGMIAGFVPTNTLATGHIIEMLLDRPEMMAACEAAARDGDDDRLERCLFEALRWRPINFGPFRGCPADTTIAAGTPRATRIRAGAVVLAATCSAMFDPRRVPQPNRFDPDRAASDYLHFGFGQHWCIGFAIARAQVTQTLKPLLTCGQVRRAAGRAGVMASYGTFPDHLTLTYRAPAEPRVATAPAAPPADGPTAPAEPARAAETVRL